MFGLVSSARHDLSAEGMGWDSTYKSEPNASNEVFEGGQPTEESGVIKRKM